MKFRSGGLCRRFSVARWALCVILVAAATLGLPTPARACGIITHTAVIQRAIERLTEENYPGLEARYPGLRELVTQYHGVVNYGAIFPDWAVAFNPELGEVAHDTGYIRRGTTPIFRAALTAEMLRPFRDPRFTSDPKDIAFLLGVISHQVSDIRYHDGGNVPCTTEPDGQCRREGLQPLAARGGILHQDLEFHSDLLLSPPKYGAEWDDPRTAVLAAYTKVSPDHNVTAVMLLHYKLVQLALYDWEVLNSYVQYPQIGVYCDWVPWPVCTTITFDHAFLETYRPGGLQDCAEYTIQAWMKTWDWLSTYTPVTNVNLSPAQPDGENGWYRQPVTVELDATDNFAGSIQYNPYTRPFETMYSVDGGKDQAYTGPFMVSWEGMHDISFYSVDSMGIAEAAQHRTLNIDLMDEPCPAGPELPGDCSQVPPPYYVVVNGLQACLERDGSGCSPFVLAHPECTTCATCNVDVETEVCKPYLTGKVPEGQKQTVYEMCRSGARWMSRVRTLDSLGNCPASGDWGDSEPPMTGVPLPAPVIVGGLVILGAGFMAAGVVLRRRKS